MSLSIQHEAPLEVCDQHPRVVASLLDLLLGEELPAFDELRMEPADFTQTVAKEFRADRALVFLRHERPVLAVILEVQRRRDERKRRAWPVYTAALYARLGCPTYLLVIALDETTARWARAPITGFQPGSRFAPLVVARGDVPAVRSLDQAQANVPLALFSALLHVGAARGAGGRRVRGLLRGAGAVRVLARGRAPGSDDSDDLDAGARGWHSGPREVQADREAGHD